jgi:hypothetical protein
VRRHAAVLLATVLALSLGATAQAAQRPTGIRITIVNVNPVTRVVDFNVTLNIDPGPSPVGPPQGLMGNFFSNGVGVGTLLNPVVNAVNYGDAVIIPRTTIPLFSPGVFRGSFSHTYAAPGTYTIRVGAAGLVGYTTTAGALGPGTPIVVANASWRGPTIMGGTTISSLPPPNNPFVIALTNTATVTLAAVPTLPLVALWTLVAVLLGVGAWMLRRRPAGPAAT